ncbi:winged helix-turn-helix transcriptional regulator [Mycobacterium sp. 21AC1]|uniref:winged helix-turn-helix transcriptional regulator n=1 Tax=[Mycobacterium] appelbergii TaxID=2939269 RepID=UPI002939497B|nr:winged helix-turn-helix transcriptional regulator [Mycobacterium sp. 21AC1]MDV3123468.1 winged helix-turn-helix transcriptional regulator [Mycobacterium sp. 21AC1]
MVNTGISFISWVGSVGHYEYRSKYYDKTSINIVFPLSAGKLGEVAGERKYGQGCAVAHSLDLVGERWALLIVRDLLLGPKRFSDLAAGLPGASPGVLTQRLKELTEAGVLLRRRLRAPAASWVYELTPWGQQLGPIVTGLAQWASRSPSMPYDAPMGTDSVMLSFGALFDPAAAADLDFAIAVHVDGEPFQVRVAHGEISVSRGDTDNADATLETDQRGLLTLLRTDTPLTGMQDGGKFRVSGDSEVVERFRRLFPLPAPEAG